MRGRVGGRRGREEGGREGGREIERGREAKRDFCASARGNDLNNPNTQTCTLHWHSETTHAMRLMSAGEGRATQRQTDRGCACFRKQIRT